MTIHPGAIGMTACHPASALRVDTHPPERTQIAGRVARTHRVDGGDPVQLYLVDGVAALMVLLVLVATWWPERQPRGKEPRR